MVNWSMKPIEIVSDAKNCIGSKSLKDAGIILCPTSLTLVGNFNYFTKILPSNFSEIFNILQNVLFQDRKPEEQKLLTFIN